MNPVKIRRLIGLATVAALVVAALTACTSSTTGSGSGSATASGGSSSAASTSSSSASSGASSSAASSSASTGTSAATVAACTGSQLTVTWSNPPGGGAAGHVGIVLLFKNTSSSTCLLSGYPGADGIDSTGHKLASASRTLNGMIGFCGCTSPPTLTLAPGTIVSAVAEGDAGGSGGPCTPFPAMLVTPPNTTVSTHIPASPYSCDFTVHPVVTGSAGQSGTP